MTLVGDVAQSTTPAGQERWADVFAYAGRRRRRRVGEIAELTIGYRVPEPILTVANRLLPLTGVDASASRSVRVEGHAPAWTHTTPAELRGDGGRRRRAPSSTATASPASSPRSSHHDAIAAALDAAGLHAVDHLHQLHHGEVPLFGPEQVKGLEFDGVVVVEPDEILGDTPRGARLLYVAMTRAVQELAFVHDSSGPCDLLTPVASAAGPLAALDVAGARADQLAVRGLLDGVGRPADRAADGERRREQGARQAGRRHHDAGEELDVARQRAVRLDAGASVVEDAPLDLDGLVDELAAAAAWRSPAAAPSADRARGRRRGRSP